MTNTKRVNTKREATNGNVTADHGAVPKNTDRPESVILKKMLRKRGFTQKTFAKAMGTTNYRVMNWIRYGVPVNRLEDAAQMLRVNVDKVPVYINERPGIYEWGNARPNYRRKTLKTTPPTKTIQPNVEPTASASDRLKALDEAYRVNKANLDEARSKLDREYAAQRDVLVSAITVEIQQMKEMIDRYSGVCEQALRVA